MMIFFLIKNEKHFGLGNFEQNNSWFFNSAKSHSDHYYLSLTSLESDSGESVSFIEKSDNSPVSMEILVMLQMPLVKKMLVLSDMSEISKAQSKYLCYFQRLKFMK